MEKTWDKYQKSCIQTSLYKVRDIHQLTHQIFSVEDIISGRFEPSKLDWGSNIAVEDTEGLRNAFINKETKMICLFDGNYDDELARKINDELEKVFEEFLPNKSSFEL